MSRLRIRSIKPEFFADEQINSLPIPGRYLALGLITRSDDRGRQRRQDAAIAAHVFPEGDVTIKQVTKLLELIIATKIALAYVVNGHTYLWLPNFWKHQVINRPTESDLPPHPDDPFGAMNIREALETFRETSSNPHAQLTENSVSPHYSRAVPIRSLPKSRKSDKGKGEVDARARTPSKPPDQDAPPSSLADELAPVLKAVLGVLQTVQGERGGNLPTARGVGLAIARYPDRDHLGVVRELEHWALAGNGQARPVKDWARTYATFLERTPPGAPTRARAPRPGADPIAGINRRTAESIAREEES